MMKALLRWLRSSTAICLRFRLQWATDARREAEMAYAEACADLDALPALTADSWASLAALKVDAVNRKSEARALLQARMGLEEHFARQYQRTIGGPA
jgi:hypothetical protein